MTEQDWPAVEARLEAYLQHREDKPDMHYVVAAVAQYPQPPHGTSYRDLFDADLHFALIRLTEQAAEIEGLKADQGINQDCSTYYEHCGEMWKGEGLQPISECMTCGESVPFALCLHGEGDATDARARAIFTAERERDRLREALEDLQIPRAILWRKDITDAERATAWADHTRKMNEIAAAALTEPAPRTEQPASEGDAT